MKAIRLIPIYLIYRVAQKK